MYKSFERRVNAVWCKEKNSHVESTDNGINEPKPSSQAQTETFKAREYIKP